MMSRFFKNSAIFLVILTIVILVILHLPMNYAHRLATIMDKYRLLREAESPKIVFVGGSGIYYAIDGPAIETATGYNVVNMGLYAKMGLYFPLDLVVPHIDSEDIVVIIPEYDMLNDSALNRMPSETRIWVYPISKSDYFSLKPTRKEMLNDFSNLLQFKRIALLKNIINGNLKTSFRNGSRDFDIRHDQCGDAIFDPFENVPTEKLEGYGVKIEFQLSDSTMARLNSYADSIRAKGGEIFLIYQAFPECEYERNRETIDALHRRLLREIKMEIPQPPERWTLPVKYFTNSVNHLDSLGGNVRTERLIEALKSEIIIPASETENLNYEM